MQLQEPTFYMRGNRIFPSASRVPYPKQWYDFRDATKITGRRILSASSQYYTAPHAADLNTGTAQTVIVWCQKAKDLSQDNCCLVAKGQVSNANFSWGSYGGSDPGFGGDSISFNTNVGGTSQASQTLSGLGALGWAFSPGTLVASRNGVIIATSTGGSVAASLQTNNDLLYIGRDPGGFTTYGYKNFDGVMFLVAIANQTLSNAELLALTTGNTPPRWADQSVSLKAKFIRWYLEDGSLSDKTGNGADLTPNGSGTIDLQTRIVSVADRSMSGMVYNAPVGRWPRYRTDIFNGQPSAHFDFLQERGPTVGASRCALTGIFPTPPHTRASGRTISAVRLTELHTDENWWNANDSGVSELYYVLEGYKIFGGSANCYRRFVDASLGLTTGGWKSSKVMALDTNYISDWYHDGSAVGHKLNGSAGIVTSDAVPTWVNSMTRQIEGGTNLHGAVSGNGFLGHIASTMTFDGYPSDRQNALADSYFAEYVS